MSLLDQISARFPGATTDQVMAYVDSGVACLSLEGFAAWLGRTQAAQEIVYGWWQVRCASAQCATRRFSFALTTA